MKYHHNVIITGEQINYQLFLSSVQVALNRAQVTELTHIIYLDNINVNITYMFTVADRLPKLSLTATRQYQRLNGEAKT